jgi:beta-hydroxylase
MQVWGRVGRKRLRHAIVFALVGGTAMYFAPIPTAILLALGALDLGRHRRVTLALVEEYFTGKGLFTWLLSPVNLLTDIFARRSRSPIRFEDLPIDCRREIETCVAAFLENGERLKQAIRPHVEAGQRVMLTFKWFDKPLPCEVEIPAFEAKFRYVKTIAVSAFGAREQTSWHFGPQRLTLRVLRTLDPVEGEDVYIAVDGAVHYWRDDPLFVFDDTFFHQSVNRAEAARYCLFMDIVRPNFFSSGFRAAIDGMSLLTGTFRAVFYRHWAFLR